MNPAHSLLHAPMDESGRRLIYANSARVSPLAEPALEAMLHAIAKRASLQWCQGDDEYTLADARRSIGTLIGAPPGRIAIVQSATYAASVAIEGLALRAGDNIVLTDLDYRSVLHAAFRAREEHGIVLRIARSSDWILSPQHVADLVDARTRLVVVPHIPSFCGIVQPVAQIGRLLRGASVIFAVNATQSVGQIPADVADIGCSLLFGTSRKWLRGPRGVGFLFVAGELIPQLRPTVLGHPGALWTDRDTIELAEDINRLHAGDYPYPAIAGFAAAAAFAAAMDPASIARRNAWLGHLLREDLGAVRGIRLYDTEYGTTGTVPLTVDGISSAEVVEQLAKHGIVACSLEASVSRWAFQRVGHDSLVRISLHHFNTPDDVRTLTAALERIALHHSVQSAKSSREPVMSSDGRGKYP